MAAATCCAQPALAFSAPRRVDGYHVMKLKITLQRPDRASSDLVVTLDASTSVAELATCLSASDPTAKPGGRHGGGASSPAQPADNESLTLRLVQGGDGTIDPRMSVLESGIRSGTSVALALASQQYIDNGAAPAAVVTVVNGPDAGREFALQRGANLLGRDPNCDIRLS